MGRRAREHVWGWLVTAHLALLVPGCGRVLYERVQSGSSDAGSPGRDAGEDGSWDAGLQSPDAAVDAGSSDAASNDTGVVADGSGSVTVTASVADCISPIRLDPDYCEEDTGPGELNVDMNDHDTEEPNHSYLAFEVPTLPPGARVTRVSLRLVITDTDGAGGESTGEVWAVEPFERADLFSFAPATMGSAPVGADLGAIEVGAEAVWELPAGLVASEEPLYLGVLPLVDDGVSYWNLNGVDPPTLRIDYE